MVKHTDLFVLREFVFRFPGGLQMDKWCFGVSDRGVVGLLIGEQEELYLALSMCVSFVAVCIRY